MLPFQKMTKHLKFTIENNYGIPIKKAWIRIENPINYYSAEAGLDKVNENEYVYRISGYFRPILNYNLFRKDIFEILNRLVPEQFQVKPIKIIRKSTGEFWTDYYEINPLQKFSNSEYDKIQCNGLMIFYIDDTIFLSEKLKELLKNELNSDEVFFREGPLLIA